MSLRDASAYLPHYIRQCSTVSGVSHLLGKPSQWRSILCKWESSLQWPIHSWNQRRTNNSSKCSNCYGPHAFGDPAVLCVKFVLYYVQEWILEFRYLKQTLRKGTLSFIHFIQKLCSLIANEIFILPGILRPCESPFRTVNCLKSFDFKLFFVCILKLLKGHF